MVPKPNTSDTADSGKSRALRYLTPALTANLRESRNRPSHMAVNALDMSSTIDSTLAEKSAHINLSVPITAFQLSSTRVPKAMTPAIAATARAIGAVNNPNANARPPTSNIKGGMSAVVIVIAMIIFLVAGSSFPNHSVSSIYASVNFSAAGSNITPKDSFSSFVFSAARLDEFA